MKQPLFKIFITISFLFLSARILPAQESENGTTNQKKKRVGVLSFTSKNVSKMETGIVNEMFRNELVASGKYNVLNRKNMEDILGEQAFQQSGCTDSSCAVQLGKILNMEYMAYGVLMKAGDKYIMSVEMVNVETSEIATSGRVTFKSMNEVEKSIVTLVEELTGVKTRGQELDQFQLFFESVYFGFFSVLHYKIDLPLEREYRPPIGGDIFVKGRLFGKPLDVLKWSWYGGIEGGYSELDNEDNANHYNIKGLEQASSLWISPYISPFLAVNVRFGFMNLLIGGDLSMLYLKEEALLYNHTYTDSHVYFPGLGVTAMLELKFAKHFSLFVKHHFNYFSYPDRSGGVISTSQESSGISYDIVRMSLTTGIAF